MNTLQFPMTWLIIILLLAFILCAFCAASETGLMALNRYRLKHLAKTDPAAKRIQKLLIHPDRLLGVILIGSTFATAVASNVANEIFGYWFGHIGILLSPILITLLLLVFAEVTPKTLAALKPEQTSRFVVYPLNVILVLLYPLVWMAATLSSILLRIFGIKVSNSILHDSLSTEELRTVVNEASGIIPIRHQNMLLSILDLEKVRVEHIMIPRNEVIGIDLEEEPQIILEQIINTQHTLLPVYRDDLDNVLGILHTRNLPKIWSGKDLTDEAIQSVMDDPYFVPEGTTLHTQLRNFQQNKRRMGLVVDEYGDVLGLVTLEDILEEIVGDFTTVSEENVEILPEPDGTWLVDGGISVRDLNKAQNFELPTEGPTTLNGLILETLESIPVEGTCVLIAGYPIEVISVKENAVKTARISPRINVTDRDEGEDQ